MSLKIKILAFILIGFGVLSLYFLFFYREGARDVLNGIKEVVPGPSVDEKGEAGDTQGSKGEEAEKKREERMVYIAQNIGAISPVRPVLGGSWYVLRFWFVDDDTMYVEYEDGHIQSRILLSAKDGAYEVKGVFEAGESGWYLTQGEDPYYEASLDLYEYSDTLGKWLKKN